MRKRPKTADQLEDAMSDCLRMDVAYSRGHLEGFKQGVQFMKSLQGKAEYLPYKSLRSPWARLRKHYWKLFRRLKE